MTTFPTTNGIQMEQQIEEFMRILPSQIKLMQIQSKLYKAKYDSLIEEGFTEEQTMKIIEARGVDG